MNFPKKLNHIDLLLITIILLISIVYPLLFINPSILPHEDAAILMRYAKNIAEGYGIVWNPGEQPVDGATDFLFMLLIAFLNSWGMPIEISTLFIIYSSHILTALIIYIFIRILYNGYKWAAFLSATYFALGPGFGYIGSFFGAPFFALFACLTWIYSYKIVENYNSPIYCVFFSIFGLTLTLIRPEGLFLMIFYIIGILWMLELKKAKLMIKYLFLIYFFIGGIYFLWRWTYFKFPLPNPYYKKGGFELYFESLIQSYIAAISMFLPFLLIFLLAIFSLIIFQLNNISNNLLKLFIFYLIPLLGFLSIWILLSNEMNFLARFQYPILPVFLLIWPIVLKSVIEVWRKIEINVKYRILNKKYLLKTSVILFIVISLLKPCFTYRNLKFFHDGRYDVAKMLNQYKKYNYTMIITEAGLLPLYSEWNAVDAWGLNDQWIAHHGGITYEYIDKFKPELIMFHAHFSPLYEPVNYTADASDRAIDWFLMVKILLTYAKNESYILAASYGINPNNTHYYYISSNFSHNSTIIDFIKNMDYIWYKTGTSSTNYAQ